jgi:hypothetical protein
MAQQVGQISPDGKWLWNGTEWIPHTLAPAAVAPPPVPWARPYESAHLRATLLTIFLLASIVGWLVLAGFNILAPGAGSQASSDTQSVLIGVGALLVLVVYFGTLIPTIVFFCMWVHRVVRNMPALGSWDPRWAPAGAVGRCFIPFLNLAHPISGTLEAWRGSDSSRRWINVAERKAMKVPGVIIGWWSLWLIGNLLSNIGSRLTSNSDSGAVATGDSLIIVGTLLVIGSAVLAVLVVRAVTARQDRKNELITTGQLA